ncbi:hypothetical protein [Ferrovibrio sp.]|uniref:hypothetical protein n=1 Tax=Ferrovibrio sp. TaxID=1917215 RepID=UPI0035AFFCA4
MSAPKRKPHNAADQATDLAADLAADLARRAGQHLVARENAEAAIVLTRLFSSWPAKTALNALAEPISTNTLSPEAALALGDFLRVTLPVAAPALPRSVLLDHATDGDEATGWINVIGNRRVFAFAEKSCFFPIFIGEAAPAWLHLERGFRETRRNMQRALRRLDNTKPLLLALAAEPHQMTGRISQNAEARQELLRRWLSRYEILFSDIQPLQRGRLACLGAAPAQLPERQALVVAFNAGLRALCESCGIDFVPTTASLIDNTDINAVAPLDPALLDSLRRIGLLTPAMEAAAAEGRARVVAYTAARQDDDKTANSRVSIRPADQQTHPRPAAAMEKLALDLLAVQAAVKPIRRILIAEARDACLPLALPPELLDQALLLYSDPAAAASAERLAAFAGREDVKTAAWRPDLLNALRGRAFDLACITLPPGEEAAAIERLLPLLDGLDIAYLLLAADRSALEAFNHQQGGGGWLGNARILSVALPARDRPPGWRKPVLAFGAWRGSLHRNWMDGA